MSLGMIPRDMFLFYRPVLPKPPWPRSVSLSSYTSRKVTGR